MRNLATIDVALDEMLVNLAAIVLQLSNPNVTRTPEARRALAQSVHQYAVCAARSTDPRVHQLKSQLEETLKPNLRIIARDGVKVS
jgi:malic enzyme